MIQKKGGHSTSKQPPRESIMPITYKLADGTLKVAQSRKRGGCSTLKHSPGSLSCQLPMNWQIGHQRLHNPERGGPFNVETLPRESIMPITYELVDRTLKAAQSSTKGRPFNVKILPRESIMPITHKLADRTSKVAQCRGEGARS
jgi:hypothetical protein